MIYDYMCMLELCLYIVARDNHENCDRTCLILSVLRLLTERDRQNYIIVHALGTLFHILNLQIYVYKLWERDNHENWSRTCRALVSPSPLLFLRFSPDSIDKSILSGLVACAELCKNFLLVCRCCKIRFPFDSLLWEGVIIPPSHTHQGTCEKRSITPLGDLRAQM